ncbi:hypothetical protein ACI48J_02825 [Paenibacillus chitinolyticus]|uniref:hypothetical protein n=1 Tax=Paenibacillus chitinolyticus TaxID=79263 RepID=UPI003870DF9D
MTLRFFQWFGKWSFPEGFGRRLTAGLIITAVLVSLVLSALLNRLVPGSMTYGDLMTRSQPASFYLPDENFTYRDQGVIESFTRLALTKQALRKEEAASAFIPGKEPLRLSYDNSKGRVILVDADGRIYTPVSKAELRNESRLHWLWWKLDTGRSSYLYYVTEPDAAIARLAEQIKSSAPALEAAG